MHLKQTLIAVVGLFLGSVLAHADTCEATATSVCEHVFEAQSVSTLLVVTVNMDLVYTYRTAFNESGKKYGIFMPCNAAGRPTCEEALVDLSYLTATQHVRITFT